MAVQGESALDASLTSLGWLQELGCSSGLAAPLQTPTSPPRTPLVMRYAQRANVLPPRNASPDYRAPTIKQLEAAIRKEHEIPTDLDWALTSEPKPPHNFATLIYMAIKSTKMGRATLSEIYAWIREHFLFYRNFVGDAWKNSIRHNLTQNKFFVRIDRKSLANGGTSKGGFWTVDLDPKFIPDFNRQVRRFGRASKDKTGAQRKRDSPRASAAKCSRGAAAKSTSSPKVRRNGMPDGKLSRGAARRVPNNPPSVKPDAAAAAAAAAAAGAPGASSPDDVKALWHRGSADAAGVFDDLCDAGVIVDDDASDMVDAFFGDDAWSSSSGCGLGGDGDGDGDDTPASAVAAAADGAALRSELEGAAEGGLDVDCMLDLVSSFSISDGCRLLPNGGDLRVVGVSMSLLPPLRDGGGGGIEAGGRNLLDVDRLPAQEHVVGADGLTIPADWGV